MPDVKIKKPRGRPKTNKSKKVNIKSNTDLLVKEVFNLSPDNDTEELVSDINKMLELDTSSDTDKRSANTSFDKKRSKIELDELLSAREVERIRERFGSHLGENNADTHKKIVAALLTRSSVLTLAGIEDEAIAQDKGEEGIDFKYRLMPPHLQLLQIVAYTVLEYEDSIYRSNKSAAQRAHKAMEIINRLIVKMKRELFLSLTKKN